MSTAEFIGLVAALMALTALAIDIMLPALPAIGEALGVANPNDRQVIIITYMLGFSVGQLGYGHLSDRYGRKPVLMAGLAVFIAGSLMASLSSDFALVLSPPPRCRVSARRPRASSPSPSCATATPDGRWRASCCSLAIFMASLRCRHHNEQHAHRQLTTSFRSAAGTQHHE